MNKYNINSIKSDKRILIIGICGAGKSTLAKIISIKFNLPVVHLDSNFWNECWVETSKEEWSSRVKELASKEKWVMDGNFGGSFDIRFPRSDTIIILDFNRIIAIFRVLKRVFKFHGKTRPDMAYGCNERFDFEFIKYIWNFYKENSLISEAALRKYCKNKKVIILKNPKEVKSFLREIN